MVRRNSIEKEIDHSSYSSDEISCADTASVVSSCKDDNFEYDLVLEDDFGKYSSTFGKVSVTNCNDIHFGNKTYYNGPVTIKQLMYTSSDKSKAKQISDNAKGDLSDNVVIQNDINKNCADVEYIKHIESNSGEIKEEKNKEGAKWFQDLPRRQVIFIASVAIVLVLSLVISTAVLLTNHSLLSVNPTNAVTPKPGDQDELDVKRPGHSKGNDSFTLPVKLKIIARTEWLAQPPTQPIDNQSLPVPYVIIMHTATEPCTDHGTCIFHVRLIQMYHIESRKWWDIGYNFVVGGDGYAYEGRGWKLQGAHTYGYNDKSIGIGLIGTFSNVLPVPRQVTATKQLIAKGVQEGYISKNYKLLGARQLQSTESPGTLFFEELKSWDHWAETP